jgi:adenosyl cobinamide kinase/adenosyl cobinamide phosphate guanylyltransferase
MTAGVTGQTKARADDPQVVFVLGGARSGKSAHAESLVQAEPGPWVYVATAQAHDDEMRARLAEHRARRPPGWRTIEAPLDLPAALAQPGPMLVDCLTLWLTNLMLVGREPDWPALLAALDARAALTVFVSNEVGLGIVPDNALARAFRDAAGRLHQRLAARADRVLFMVAGLPMVVK